MQIYQKRGGRVGEGKAQGRGGLLGKYTSQHGLTAWKNLAVQEYQAFIDWAIKLILLKLLLTIIKPLMILLCS